MVSILRDADHATQQQNPQREIPDKHLACPASPYFAAKGSIRLPKRGPIAGQFVIPFSEDRRSTAASTFPGIKDADAPAWFGLDSLVETAPASKLKYSIVHFLPLHFLHRNLTSFPRI
jgi:hypothetical protein